MIILRIAAVIILISIFVLLATYLVTRKQKYLQALKKLLNSTAWCVLLLALLALISRVIRL